MEPRPPSRLSPDEAAERVAARALRYVRARRRLGWDDDQVSRDTLKESAASLGLVLGRDCTIRECIRHVKLQAGRGSDLLKL